MSKQQRIINSIIAVAIFTAGCDDGDVVSLRTDGSQSTVDVALDVGAEQGFSLADLKVSAFSGSVRCAGPRPVELPIGAAPVQMVAGATGCIIKLSSFTLDGQVFSPTDADGFATYAMNDSATFQNEDRSVLFKVKVASAQLPSPLIVPTNVQYYVTQGTEDSGNVNVSNSTISTTNANLSVGGSRTPELRLAGAKTVVFDGSSIGLTLTYECSTGIVGTGMTATCAGDRLNAFKVGIGAVPARISDITLNAILNGPVKFLTSAADVNFIAKNSSEAPNGGFKVNRKLSDWSIADLAALSVPRYAVIALANPAVATSFNYSSFSAPAFSWRLNNGISIPGPLVAGSCNGAKYVRSTTYKGLYVAAIHCSNEPKSKVKLLLAASAAGPYREIGDEAGHGQDHCELMNPSFTLPNSDDINSGNCQTCEIGSNPKVAASPFYHRSNLGDNFVLQTTAPAVSQQSSPFLNCGVDLP
jgi:hypothetical protein